MRFHSVARILPALILLCVVCHPALAAWPNSPFTNLPVSTAAYDQFGPAMIPDGSGGAIITWMDSRNGIDNNIYAQHVLASGIVDPAWPANGTQICGQPFDQGFPQIVSDGAGGAIITWQDARGNAVNYDIYAQHVRTSGTVDPAWPADGRALCTATNNQTRPTIVSDGAGGAIVTWQDNRSGTNYDVYAQHVLASGAVDPAWTALNGNANGTPLSIAANDQISPVITSDGAGGAIVAWQDYRSGTNYDVYAQHVLAGGAVDPIWTTLNGNANGSPLCTAAGDQSTLSIVPDGAGGAIVTWQDVRGGNNDIYAQHVLANGAVDIAWTPNGTPLCTAAGNQNTPTSVSDGAGGAIATWYDIRGASWDIYAQHVLATGTVDPAWPANGAPLCTAVSNQYFPTITTDGAGGAIVAWEDGRAPTYDIYATRVLASGTVDPNWPANGRAVSTATGDQQSPVIVSDGAGGAVVAWPDRRAGSFDVYAERVARFGYLGTPEAEITEVKDVPNDNGGKVKLTWNASYLDLNSDPNLSWYEIYRSTPPNAVADAIARGARVLRSFAETPTPRFESIVIDDVNGYGWEYLTSQSALHYLPSYGYVAPTLEDSTGYQNPKTAFMIVARNGSGTMYWLSRPDSGYSVDNLPPLPPAPFTGQFNAGLATLHWDPNTEPDFANYRLYRGTTSSFTPSPANLIASPPDTGYADPAGATYWYKISAVDTHGNESGFSTLLPAGALDVSGGALPRELALERPSPNPASGPLTLRYALPHETRVALAIYDAAGRRVRELVSGTQPAGAYALTWDRRDDAGHVLGAGLYFVRLEAERRVFSQRFATLN